MSVRAPGVRKNSRNREVNDEEAYEMYRMLLEDPEFDVDSLTSKTRFHPWWWGCPDYTCARLVRGKFSASFSMMSWETQVELAMNNSVRSPASMPQMFLEMLGYSHVDSRIAHACDGSGRTACHVLASQLGQFVDDNLPSTWVDFLGKLLKHGADIHHKAKSGHTPFTLLLHSMSSFITPTSTVKTWTRLLDAADVDLAEYGRFERRVWYQKKCYHNYDETLTFRGWTYGPCVDDWSVDSVSVMKIPVYMLEPAPGRWPGNDEYNTKTICWEPMEEDFSREAERWSLVRNILINSEYHPYLMPLSGGIISGREKRAYRAVEFKAAQDDCGAIIRLVQTTCRARVRPRRCSQPAKLESHELPTYRTWLPRCHFCMGDSQVKFADATHLMEARKCAKVNDPACSAHGYDIYESIERQMRRFQTRYRDVNELKALPYAAYHPTWKREYAVDPEQR